MLNFSRSEEMIWNFVSFRDVGVGVGEVFVINSLSTAAGAGDKLGPGQPPRAVVEWWVRFVSLTTFHYSADQGYLSSSVTQRHER
jgi:hypothetical protein